MSEPAAIRTTYSNEVFPPPPSFGALSYQLKLCVFHLVMAFANMWLCTLRVSDRVTLIGDLFFFVFFYVRLRLLYIVRNAIFFDPVKKGPCTGASPIVLPHYVHDVNNRRIGVLYQLPFVFFHLTAGLIYILWFGTRQVDLMEFIPTQNWITIALHSCFLGWLIASCDKKVSDDPPNVIGPFILTYILLYLANPDPNLYLGASHLYDLRYPMHSFVVAIYFSTAGVWLAWIATFMEGLMTIRNVVKED